MWLLLARCLGLPTGLLVCSGRGSLLPNGGCACHAGWSGPACARRGCKRECSGHGICLDGLCSCEPAWRGDDCGRRPVPAVVECPHSCWGRGACDFATGRCHCDVGFSGDDCSDGLCPRGCSGHGTCVDGTQPAVSHALRGFASDRNAGHSFIAGGCLCDPGRTGRDCSLLRCVDSCSGHGACLNGTCSCEPGYGGRACAAPACPYPCLNGGACGGGGGCRCAHGWGGSDCSAPLGSQTAAWLAVAASPSSPSPPASTPTPSPAPALEPAATARSVEDGKRCPGDCSGHGRCSPHTGRCACHFGWGGPSCQASLCPGACTGRGACVDGACLCVQGWAGPDCSTSRGARRDADATAQGAGSAPASSSAASAAPVAFAAVSSSTAAFTTTSTAASAAAAAASTAASTVAAAVASTAAASTATSSATVATTAVFSPPSSPPPPPIYALCIDGYWPLFVNESESDSHSTDGTSHVHNLHAADYFMPNAFAGAIMTRGGGDATWCPEHAFLLPSAPSLSATHPAPPSVNSAYNATYPVPLDASSSPRGSSSGEQHARTSKPRPLSTAPAAATAGAALAEPVAARGAMPTAAPVRPLPRSSAWHACPGGCGEALGRGFCPDGDKCFCKLGWTGPACGVPLSAASSLRKAARPG